MTTETRNYSLYYLKHPIGREIRYVGITNNPERRLKEHLHNSNNKRIKYPVYDWIRKLAKQGLEPAMEILKSGLTKEEAEQAEIETIALYRKYSNRMLNVSAGGNLNRVGIPCSEEAKEKLRKANKDNKKLSEANKGNKNPYFGKTHSEETKKKISEANKGKTLSEETRKKISEANKNRFSSEEARKKLSEAVSGEKNPNFGKPLSDEQKKKMSEAIKDRLSSEEIKKKISESSKGRGAKTYTFLYNGNKVVIHNLSQFCKDNNLRINKMRNILSGRRKYHKGWTAANKGEK